MPHHRKKTTNQILLVLVLIVLIGGENNNPKQKIHRTSYEEALKKPEDYLLNSTLIRNAGPEFLKRQIELLHDYSVHVWCKNQNDIPDPNNYISRDYVDMKHNKTTYYLHTFVCIEDEHEVCVDQLYRPDSSQGLAMFENLFLNTTDGNTIFVKEIRRYITCEHETHLPASHLSYEDRFYALGLTLEEVQEMPGAEQREIIKQGLIVAHKYMIQRDKAINEYRKTLPVEPFIVGELFLIEKINIFENRTLDPAKKQKLRAYGFDFMDFGPSMFFWFHSTIIHAFVFVLLACVLFNQRLLINLVGRDIDIE